LRTLAAPATPVIPLALVYRLIYQAASRPTGNRIPRTRISQMNGLPTVFPVACALRRHDRSAVVSLFASF